MITPIVIVIAAAIAFLRRAWWDYYSAAMSQ